MTEEGPGRVARPKTIDDLLEERRVGLRRISPEDSLAVAARDGLIVDMRSEFQRQQQGLVPGAYFVPRNVLEWRATPTCEFHDPHLAAVTGPLILMCHQGYQSSLAAVTLQDLGVTRATDMIGGFELWEACGLPVLHGGDGAEEADRPAVKMPRVLSWRF